MKKTLVAMMCALILGAIPSAAQWGPRPIPEPTDGLKDAYKDYFKIGVAVNNKNVQPSPRRASSTGRMPTRSPTSAAPTASSSAATP